MTVAAIYVNIGENLRHVKEEDDNGNLFRDDADGVVTVIINLTHDELVVSSYRLLAEHPPEKVHCDTTNQVLVQEKYIFGFRLEFRVNKFAAPSVNNVFLVVLISPLFAIVQT